MIGQDQWVEARKVAQVVINQTPPDGANALDGLTSIRQSIYYLFMTTINWFTQL